MAAARNHHVLKHTIRLFSSRSGKEGLAGGGAASSSISSDEFDESEIVWASSSPPKIVRARHTWNSIADRSTGSSAVGSLPVNIPDWPRIRTLTLEEEEEGGVEEEMMPPHEMVWRHRVESFSVVEGIGRTLKGRDLSRVRNAVWAQTGYLD